MEFSYPSTVGAEELRLLKPVSITQHSLHFRVETFPRRATPPYTAVSYTWGSGAASETIYLDGRRLSVRLNLWSCLYYLSLGSNYGDPPYLWVDAICIDQSNNDERDAQVRRMDETYRSAEYVSVWLGLPKVPDYIAMPRQSIGTFEDAGFDWWDHLVDLANRPYWSRFWVIQEFLLGKNVILFCGNHRVPWTRFRDIVCRRAGVSEVDPDFDSSGRAANSAAASYRALPFLAGRHVDKHPEFLQPFHNLIISHHRSECKDPRDRVFALLGLVTLEEREALERFFPNYSVSEEHVRIIALSHVLQFPADTSHEEITPDSDELFLGLGVTSRWERRALLRRARIDRFDYLGYTNIDEASAALTLYDDFLAPESDEGDDDDTRHGSNTISTGIRRVGMAIAIFALVAAVRVVLSGKMKNGKLMGFTRDLLQSVSTPDSIYDRGGGIPKQESYH